MPPDYSHTESASQTDPAPCPKCPWCGSGLLEDSMTTFTCGSEIIPPDPPWQSVRCENICLTHDLAAARASIGELQEMVSAAEGRANERGRERDALAAEVGSGGAASKNEAALPSADARPVLYVPACRCDLDEVAAELAAVVAERDLLAGLLEQAEAILTMPNRKRVVPFNSHEDDQTYWMVSDSDGKSYATAIDAIRAALAGKGEGT